ncbi:bifunctional riboflavin kinase/FAD synthetase [Cytophagaceae bacterium ABcell3]|nr:bifunctional riboflavin kinase/FAD synthetase [Cytophagaceae bacterium ABcell3]
MKLYKGTDEFQKLPFAVVTGGTFDGVHKGHQKILRRLNTIAQQEHGESVVITYWPVPRMVLKPDDDIQILTTPEEKIQLIEDAGIDHLIMIPFSKEFAAISSYDFVRGILADKIGTKKLVIGYDHRFGKNREGGFEYLKANESAFGFEVEEIPREDINNNTISSTFIRESILKGDVANVVPYLGRNYSISGKVVHGNKLGRTIGYPTANVVTNYPEKLIPGNGIYAVKVKVKNNVHDGMMSIGIRPTVGGTKRTVEVNIFDFNEDIYGEAIEVYFYEYLRPELKFDSLEELVKAIDQDKENTLKYFNKFSHTN